MKYTFGFIGVGNMGGALACAAKRDGEPFSALLADLNTAHAAALAEKLSCDSGSSADAAQNSKYIFLGVKPQVMENMLREISPILAARKDRFVLVTMAAGLSMEKIAVMSGGKYPIIRIMPNVAASVGEAMILCAANQLVTAEETDEFMRLMSGAGRIDMLDEKLFDAGCALSGSGPAYVFMFMEALADGGVACGLPRAKALEYAAQTLIGSAKLMLQSGRHPGELKDAVCSPAGTTVAGVAALENDGFRAAAIDAVKAAYNRSVELGK